MLRFRAAGDAAVIAEFGTEIDRALSQEVFDLYEQVISQRLRGVIACIPAFTTLLVQFDPLETDGDSIIEELTSLADQPRKNRKPPSTTWDIPVCYERSMAPDLESAAQALALSPDAFAAQHASRAYVVYMLGGFPGFPYLGDVPEPVRIPRRTSPRTRVDAGFVAVAGRLSAIYPVPTPGGWNLIGRTPIPIFDVAQDEPALLRPGDEVVFRPISEREFHAIQADAARGAFVRSDFKRPSR
jgi:KipI family sensor histidine kinase inhibitor